MAWALVGTGAAVTGVNVASLDVPVPGGVAVGHLLVLQVYSRTSSARDPNLPSGWTEGERRGANGGHLLAFRIANGTEGSTVNVSFTGAGASNVSQIAQMAAFSGNDTGQASVLSSSTDATWTSAADMGPITGLTPPVADCLLVVCAGKQNSIGGSVATLTGDSQTWAELWESENTSGFNCAIVAGYAILTGTPTITDKTFDQSDGGSGLGAGSGFMVLFKPTAAALVVTALSATFTLPSPTVVNEGSQIARPVADLVGAGWAPTPDDGALWSKIDEAVPNDADYALSPAAPGDAQPLEMRFSQLVPPASTVAGGTLRVRLRLE